MTSDDCELASVEQCCRIVDAAASTVDGFYLVTPQRRFDVIANIVNYIRDL